jgi:hypothetical protein
MGRSMATYQYGSIKHIRNTIVLTNYSGVQPPALISANSIPPQGVTPRARLQLHNILHAPRHHPVNRSALPGYV